MADDRGTPTSDDPVADLDSPSLERVRAALAMDPTEVGDPRLQAAKPHYSTYRGELGLHDGLKGERFDIGILFPDRVLDGSYVVDPASGCRIPLDGARVSATPRKAGEGDRHSFLTLSFDARCDGANAAARVDLRDDGMVLLDLVVWDRPDGTHSRGRWVVPNSRTLKHTDPHVADAVWTRVNGRDDYKNTLAAKVDMVERALHGMAPRTMLDAAIGDNTDFGFCARETCRFSAAKLLGAFRPIRSDRPAAEADAVWTALFRGAIPESDWRHLLAEDGGFAMDVPAFEIYPQRYGREPIIEGPVSQPGDRRKPDERGPSR